MSQPSPHCLQRADNLWVSPGLRRPGLRSVTLLALVLLLLSVGGCASDGRAADGPAAEEVEVLSQAAYEATALVRAAEATAVMLRAQAEATALMRQAATPPAAPRPGPAGPSTGSSPLATPTPEAGEAPPPVELVGVGFAADGDYIMVQFRSDPRVSLMWRQGNVYVIDEATDTRYGDIPVMPVVGPLLGQPVEEGQLGYVMFLNHNRGLSRGASVTVVLGDFRQEHVLVE